MKRYLLDTSVIIDSPGNIANLYQGGENEVYVTNIVLKELDKHKEDPYGEKGYNARLFARSIEVSDQRPPAAPAKNGDYLRVVLFQTEEGEKIPLTVISRQRYKTSLKDNDSKIIDIAKEYGLVLLTADNYMRFNALAIGVDAELINRGSVDSPEKLRFDKTIELPFRAEDRAELYDAIIEALPEPAALPNYLQLTVTYESTSRRDYFILKKNGYGELILDPVDEDEFDEFIVRPINEEQRFYAHILSIPELKILPVTGSTGSGKTLLALQEGIRRVESQDSPIDGIIYMRNTVTANDKEAELGFRKGDEDQKLSYFAYPLYGAINFILEELSKKKGTSLEGIQEIRENGTTKKSTSTEEFMEKYNIEVVDIAHARGVTFPNKFVIFDELQNAPDGTVKLIGTRMGKGSVLVCLGDYKQVDHPYLSPTRNGMVSLMKKAFDSGLPGVQLKKTIRSEIAEWFESNY